MTDYKYLGKEKHLLLSPDGTAGATIALHIFEDDIPNGYGHQEKYGCIYTEWDFIISYEIFRSNGRGYYKCSQVPVGLMRSILEIHDILHKI